MAKKREKNKDERREAASVAAENELGGALWAVISFEKCEAGGLSYEEAERKIAELETRGIAGLCIVTDEAAARMK